MSQNVASGGNCVSQKTVKWLGRGSFYGQHKYGHQFNSRSGCFYRVWLLFSCFLYVSCSPAGFCFACRLFSTVLVRSRPFPTEKEQNRKRRKDTSGRSRPFPSVPYCCGPKKSRTGKGARSSRKQKAKRSSRAKQARTAEETEKL